MEVLWIWRYEEEVDGGVEEETEVFKKEDGGMRRKMEVQGEGWRYKGC